MLNKLGAVKADEPMKNHTSFKTGGPADIVIWPKDRDSLKDILMIAEENSINTTVLGGCTNLLVGDSGIRGIVIMMNSGGMIEEKPDGSVYADSMIRKKDFLNYCIDEGYGNVEFLAGLPGCIGGGIFMNAGTTDGNFSDILESVDCLKNREIINIKISKEIAEYRNMALPEAVIVFGGYFKLKKSGDMTGVRNNISRIIAERKLKHPLEYPSAGSVFKNPEGHFSWKLVRDSGLSGKTIGGACVSEKHTNFIINTGNATSRDILDLINHVKERVYAEFGIVLEPEIKMIGEF